jgi:hypothetical protein
MSSEFLTFQRFKDAEQAKMLTSLLDEAGIVYEVEDVSPTFDVTFAGSKLDNELLMKLQAEDFAKADTLLLKAGEAQLETTDENYYLYDFSDEDLIEIVLKPDEWSRFDYVLAQKILQERGKDIRPEVLALIKSQRLKELAKPQKEAKTWIIAGYFLAFMGLGGGVMGIVAFFMGLNFMLLKKTLPSGERIYSYSPDTRWHGLIIMLLSILGSTIGLIYFGYLWDYLQLHY